MASVNNNGLFGRLRRGAASLLLRDDLERLHAARDAFWEMAHWQPLHAEQALQSLVDLGEGPDQRYYDLLARLRQSSEGFLLGREPTEQDRLLSVQESRMAFDNDPFLQRAVGTWTDYGAGVHLDINIDDDEAREVWEEFWNAPRNNRYLGDLACQQYSDTLLTDGEFFWTLFTSKLTGESTVRCLLSDEVGEIITSPDDEGIALYYRRQVKGLSLPGQPTAESKDLFYPDWLATDDMLRAYPLPSGAERADRVENNTDVRAMQVAHMRRGLKGKRGWPLGKTGFAWSRSYRSFLHDRAAVAKLVASAVDKIVAKTGSRGLDQIRNRFQSSLVDGDIGFDSNPPPVAGSIWMENESITRQRMPQSTGATDARWDGFTIGSMAALGSGNVPIMFLGRPDMAQNRAVAQVLMSPFLKQMQRYQLFLNGMWRDLVEVVLAQREQYGPSVTFESKEAHVTTDTLVEVTVSDVLVATQAMSQAIQAEAPPELLKRMAIQLMQMTLQSLGVTGVDTILGMEDGVPDKWLVTTSPETGLPEAPEPEPEGPKGPAPGEEDVTAPKGTEATEVREDDDFAALSRLIGRLEESHSAEEVRKPCPLCEGPISFAYPDHKGLLVCASCSKTWDPGVERALGKWEEGDDEEE